MDIVMLSSDDLRRLAAAAQVADKTGRTLRVAVDGGTFKYKVGEGMWSPPCYDTPF